MRHAAVKCRESFVTIAFVFAAIAGCGEDEGWTPAAVGPIAVTGEGGDIDLSLEEDMVEAPPTPDDESPDLTAAEAEPRVLFVWYADGSPPPSRSLCARTPPPFTCTYGGAEGAMGCKRAIQWYLDAMYRDFNIVFTHTKPASGRYYTVVVTTENSWCRSGTVGGIAPFDCTDVNGSTAYAFKCGSSGARACAAIIAQEQAHLVGLAHTNSANDIMSPTLCQSCSSFENKENTVVGNQCRPTQNSYQLMLEHLGAWPSGTSKPDPFAPGCIDGEPPTVTIVEPSDGAAVRTDFTVKATVSDDCRIATADLEMQPFNEKATSIGGGPFQWDVVGIAGEQTLTVTVTDATGKTASASIKVRAGAGAPGGSGGTGAGGEGGTGAGGAGGTGGSSEGGAGGGGGGGPSADDPSLDRGCGCALAASRDRGNDGHLGAAFVLGAALLVARRRRRSDPV